VVEHSLGKGEVESSILSCSTVNSSELSPVFFLKSRPAATHSDQKISSRLSATAVHEAANNRQIEPIKSRLISVENTCLEPCRTLGPTKSATGQPADPRI
jgi:hypothetical protein